MASICKEDNFRDIELNDDWWVNEPMFPRLGGGPKMAIESLSCDGDLHAGFAL